jgi:hypothetical protein
MRDAASIDCLAIDVRVPSRRFETGSSVYVVGSFHGPCGWNISFVVRWRSR